MRGRVFKWWAPGTQVEAETPALYTHPVNESTALSLTDEVSERTTGQDENTLFSVL